MLNASKSHPVVLGVAIMLTLFSIIGSAAISGLIPVNQPQTQNKGVQDHITVDDAEVLNPWVRDKSASDTHGASQDASAVTEKLASNDHVSKVKPLDCAGCAEVISIRTVEQQGDASGLGAIAGGVAGGLLGNQIGKGNGRTVMTILGAGGGAYAGHTIEKNVNTKVVYVIKLRNPNGSIETIRQKEPPAYQVGDKLKLKGDQFINA